MKITELKAQVYDLLVQKSLIDMRLNDANKQISNACKKCQAVPCECKDDKS